MKPAAHLVYQSDNLVAMFFLELQLQVTQHVFFLVFQVTHFLVYFCFRRMGGDRSSSPRHLIIRSIRRFHDIMAGCQEHYSYSSTIILADRSGQVVGFCVRFEY